MGVNREALQLCAVYKKLFFFGRQVTQKIRIRYYKSHAGCVRACNEIEGLHDKIIITIVRSVYPKGYEIRTMKYGKIFAM